MSVFLYGSGADAGHRHAVDLRLRGAADVREDDHVVLRSQVGFGLQLLIGEVGVRDAVGVERRAHPAFILRARPAVDVADARNVEVVRAHRRRRCHRPGRQAEILQHRLELRAIGVRRRSSEPARNFLPFNSKSSSAAAIFTSAFLKRNVTRLLSAVCSTIERRAGAFDAAVGLHRAGDLRHRLREDRLVGRRSAA